MANISLTSFTDKMKSLTLLLQRELNWTIMIY